MSKESKNIFDFFKTQYEEQSHEDHGWNTPPDFVFEDAINVVNAQKSKKKGTLLYIFFTGLILSAIIISNHYVNSRIENIEQRVDKLTEQNELNNPRTKTTDTTTATHTSEQTATPSSISKAQVRDQEVELPSANQIKKLQKNKQLSIKEASSTNTQPTNSITSPTLNFSSSADIVDEKKNLVERPLAAVSSDKGQAVTMPIAPQLATLDITDIDLSKTDLPPALSLDLAQNTTTLPNLDKKGIALSLVTKLNFSSLKMSVPANSPQTLTKYDKYYSGYGAQLNATFPVTSRVSLLGSLSFDKLRNRSLYNATMSYDKSNEVSMSGEMAMYSQDNELSTPMGELENRMSFMVDPLAYEDGTTIQENTSILQAMSVVGLHLGPQLNLIENNKILWTTSVQLGVNYVNKMVTQVNSEYKILNNTMSEKALEFPTINSMEKTSGSVALSSYFHYQFNDSSMLTFGVGTMRSLNSLRSQIPETYLVNWSAQVGVTRKF